MEPIRPRRRPMADINVVPYIDVMLVLLIVFMVTAPLLSQGISVDLPDSDAQLTPETEPLIVSIDAKGKYFINVGEGQKSPVSLDVVKQRIKVIRNRKPDTPVFIEGDEKAEYGWVVTLMSQLQQDGIAKVGLVTEPVSKG